MRASAIADSFQHIVTEFRIDQNRLNKVEEEIMQDRQRVAVRIQELEDGDTPMVSTPVRSSSSSSSSSALSQPQAPPLRPRPHGDRYTQHRRQLSYLAVHLDNSTSSVSIPSAFRPYDRKDEHKNEISNNTRRQLLSEVEMPVPPSGEDNQDRGEDVGAPSAEASAERVRTDANAPGVNEAKEAKEQEDSEILLRSGSIKNVRPGAYRYRHPGIPDDHRNTSPNWHKLKRALGHSNLQSRHTAIQPVGGWTLENTRSATRHASHCIIGNGNVLHHPECRQLRREGGVYACNTYVVAPYVDSSPEHGFRYPVLGGCCYKLWAQSPNKANRLNRMQSIA